MSSSNSRSPSPASCVVGDDDDDTEYPQDINRTLRFTLSVTERELAAAKSMVQSLTDNLLQAKKEIETLNVAARSAAGDLATCKATALESAAALDVARKRLASATGACNTLIEAVQKGQKSGAYTLEEAAAIFNTIKRLQSELA